ncbi:transaldolase, partial [Buchnera aphidicola (Hormaphis cornu)]
DIQSIIKYSPQDATTNPTLILQTIKDLSYQYLIKEGIEYAKRKGGNKIIQINNASNKIVVNIGAEILKYIPGRISTEVDARYSFNTKKSVDVAKRLIQMYEKLGIHRERVLIKLAATWEGIQAAKQLKFDNIQCNLTLLFSFAQARACADANVFLISPFVGRIYDWYDKNRSFKINDRNIDPGVSSVIKIFNYYKQHDYKTIIMAASFRKIEQILALSGCDFLTISPFFLKILSTNNQKIERKLFAPDKVFYYPQAISEAEFRFKHNEDSMAVEKLSEGIRLFGNDQHTLEKIIEKAL